MKRKQRNANLNVNTAWSRGFRIPVYCGSTAIFFVSIPYGGHWQALNAKVDSFYFEKEMYVFLLFQTAHTRFGRLLKNCAQGRHAVLRRSRQCSHMLEDAALVVLPDALPDDLIPVFQQPATLCFFVKPVDGLCMPLAPAAECRKASRVPIAIFIITPIDILI